MWINRESQKGNKRQKKKKLLEIKIYNNIKTKQNTAAGKQGKTDWGWERKYSKKSKNLKIPLNDKEQSDW